jgi:hypothetical protein
VSSPRYALCAAGRWVNVFVQCGARQNPQRDLRIARVRARGSRYAYQWSIKTNRRARFYARAGSQQGCRSTNSVSVVQTFSSTSEGDASGFPVCSPYVDEDHSTTCHFEEMRLSLKHTFSPCVIGDDDDCSGIATSGPYPWGQYGRDGLGPGRDPRQIKLECPRVRQ